MTILENDVTNLEDHLEDVETDNTLQDARFNNIDNDINNIEDDIKGGFLMNV